MIRNGFASRGLIPAAEATQPMAIHAPHPNSEEETTNVIEYMLGRYGEGHKIRGPDWRNTGAGLNDRFDWEFAHVFFYS